MSSTIPLILTAGTGSKGKPGRKPNDISALLGVTFNRLTIVSEAPRRGIFDRNRRVNVECSCGAEPFAVRLADVTSGHTVSCGCRQRETFNDHQDGLAMKLEPKIVRKVFKIASGAGHNDTYVAMKCGVHRYTVRAICRLHKARLLDKFGDAFRSSWNPSFPRDAAKPTRLERRWLRRVIQFICAVSGPLVLEWNDLSEELQAAMTKWPGVPDLQLT
jgi:hypothetical protein